MFRLRSTATIMGCVMVGCILLSGFSQEMGAQADNSNMYEISARPWLYSLSLKHGRNISRLVDIPTEELSALKQKGVEMVWLMGVWRLGAYGLNFDRTDAGLLAAYRSVLPDFTQADIIGSPYAITEYTVNPELGSVADLAALRARLNSMGLKLMLDFVPNHSAVDASQVSSNPDFYVRIPRGTQPPYDPNAYLPSGIAYGSDGYGHWKDTAQYNYWNLDTRAARTKELLTVASVADAIRCDMAFLAVNDLFEKNWGSHVTSWGFSRPSTEFWSEAIPTVKRAYPHVLFLAEVYSPWERPLQAQGFDYTYDKLLYDIISANNLDNLRGYISSASVPYLTASAHFVANHDEERAAAHFGGWAQANAAALIMYTLPGMHFYWMGDFEGYKAKLDVHLRRERSEPVHEPTEQFYARLLPIVTSDVFKKGTWTYLSVGGSGTSWRLMAWRWEYNDGKSIQKRLCVINYSDAEGVGSVVVSNAVAPGGTDDLTITELLSGQSYVRSASQMRTSGLLVIIPAWYAQIFAY
jgi:hypothetical protein